MTDKQETGVFIIWEKGRYLSVPILRDISTEFEIKKVFEMYWPKQEFAVRPVSYTHLPQNQRRRTSRRRQYGHQNGQRHH